MYLHDAQLSNVVTAYATCLAGIVPMLYCWALRSQPRRWFMVYFCVLLTGIPTVWLHACEGNRIASFFDVGTNILLAWVLQVAASGDYMKPRSRRIVLGVTALFNLFVYAWLLHEIVAVKKVPLITFGAFGEFYTGEAALILNAWVAVFLLFGAMKGASQRAKRLLRMLFALFFLGMLLATAGNSQISVRFFAWHATWHIVGAFGFMTLFLLNHVRFGECAETAE